jgi:hypothetical protein
LLDQGPILGRVIERRNDRLKRNLVDDPPAISSPVDFGDRRADNRAWFS